MKTKEDAAFETYFTTELQDFALVEDRISSSNGEPMGKEEEERGPAEYEEAITACGYGKFHYIFLLVLILTSTAQLFSSGTMSYVIPIAECDLQLTNFHKGALNAGVYAGMITAAFFWGFASDVLGRRKLIIIGFFLEFVFNFLTTVAHTFWVLLVLKICGGLSVTGPNALLYSYTAETHDTPHRAKIIMITGGLIALAQVIQPAMAYAIIPMTFRYEIIPGVLDFTAWRLFLLLCSLPSLFSALAFVFLPESPKFLMSKGRTDEAMQIFQKIYSINSGKPPNTYPIKELEAPPKNTTAATVLAASSPSGGGIGTILRNGWVQIRPIFRPPYVSTALTVFAIQICIMICLNSFRLWVPQLLATLEQAETLAARNGSVVQATTICDLLGDSLGSTAEELSEIGHVCAPIKDTVYLRSLVIGVATLISFVVSTLLIGCVGKKYLTRMCFPIPAIMAVSMNWATSSDTFMTLMAVYSATIENAVFGLSALNVDLFPTAFRSVSVSLTMMFGRMASLTGNLLFPILLTYSCSAVFFSIGSVLTVAGVLIWFLPTRIETR